MKMQILIAILLLMSAAQATQPSVPSFTIVCTPGEAFAVAECASDYCLQRAIESTVETGVLTLSTTAGDISSRYELENHAGGFKVVDLKFRDDVVSGMASDAEGFVQGVDEYLKIACTEDIPLSNLLDRAHTLKKRDGSRIYEFTLRENGPVPAGLANDKCATGVELVEEWMIIYEPCSRIEIHRNTLLNYLLMGAGVMIIIAIAIVLVVKASRRPRGQT